MMDKKRPVTDIYPLSPIQQGILYHTLEDGQPGMYFTQWIYEIADEPDLSALRQATERVLDRHTALRTCFIWEKREIPVQVVLAEVRLPWQAMDWRDLRGDEYTERLTSFLAEDRSRGFDLRKAPLLRVTALQLDGGRTVLVWSHHHILLDGWSLTLLLSEVTLLYEELRTGRPAEIPPARPFGDFISWLQGRSSAAAEEFWRRTLAGFQSPTPVPLDRRAGRSDGEESYPQIDQALSTDLTIALKSFARRNRLTLNTVVKGCWALILARHSGSDDVLFGVTVTGRPTDLDEVESMIGLFINTVPMRVRMAPADRLAEWLGRLQAQQVEVMPHEHTPLLDVHGWSDVPRSTPLFETVVNYLHDTPKKSTIEAAGSLRVVSSRSIIQANFPLSLGVSPEPQINLSLSFDALRFTESSARRILIQVEVLLGAFVERADAALLDLPLLGKAEERQVLSEWGARRKEWPAASVPELFAAVAAASPDAPALVGDETSLSFRELDRRTNRLARCLRRLGVGAEVPVAICLDRSWQAIVALLAVLKAGGAYVVLEPTDPEERLTTLVRQAGARVVVARGQEPLVSVSGIRRLDLEADSELIAGQSSEPLPDPPLPEALAYILFTSGSTGKPKGVMIEHRQLVQYVSSVREALDLQPGMSYALVSTLAADLGHTSIYPALLSGGCLHVVSRERAMDPEALAEHFRRQPVDCLKIVPSHLQALLRTPDAAGLLPASRLVLGGEPSTWEEVDRLRSLMAHCRIFNHYGPTETTVGVTTCELSHWEGERPSAGVPLGRPLPHACLYVIDSHGQPAAVGVAGEIFIGGAGLARGYLGEPRATAERFVPDPFSRQCGERLYRSGDRARWLPDGTLEFLGRLDDQVKIRGFRVELGEIEAVLQAHPAVTKAVAVVRGERASAQIVAYVVGAPSTLQPAADERVYSLPNGMTVFHQNEHETRYLFDEIFVKRSYFRHGVRLPVRGCVIDAGANIGLFSLFISRNRPELPVYAFEPAQPLFDTLRANAKRHGGRITAFASGLAESEKLQAFNYYPFYSIQSGLAALANPAEDIEVVRAVQSNTEAGAALNADELGLGFEMESLTCQFERLSDVLRRESIDHVGLLKIDVQRAEMEVLLGVDEADWPKIDQVVVEVHDRLGGGDTGGVERVTSFLRDRGFCTTVEQDDLLRSTDRYNVYAVREMAPAAAAFDELEPAAETAMADMPTLNSEGLKAYLAERLPGHMVPSGIVVLDQLPLTDNGKVDRRRLPDLEVKGPAAGRTLPRNPLEQELAAVWSEVLGIGGIRVEDNFFDLGGHSLRAMQLITRLRRRFQVELSLREFLSSPTISDLAVAILQKKAEKVQGDEMLRLLEEVERMPATATPPSRSM